MLDLHSIVFYLIATFTGLCAIATVVSYNIVRSATWLLFTLGGASGVFFLLGADFVGATQLLIYVGGTMVLVVFGVMLTAQGPFINMKTSGAEWAISIVVGITLFALLCVATSFVEKRDPPPAEDPQSSHHTATLGQALLGAGYGPPYTKIEVEHKGKKETIPIGTNYLLPFEIVSVHLLVVLIGAAYLARAKRPRGEQA
jgi:NADH-quinone oxidoreductase subunit J